MAGEAIGGAAVEQHVSVWQHAIKFGEVGQGHLVNGDQCTPMDSNAWLWHAKHWLFFKTTNKFGCRLGGGHKKTKKTLGILTIFNISFLHGCALGHGHSACHATVGHGGFLQWLLTGMGATLFTIPRDSRVPTASPCFLRDSDL